MRKRIAGSRFVVGAIALALASTAALGGSRLPTASLAALADLAGHGSLTRASNGVPSACPGHYVRRVPVSSAAELRAALADARPGDLILLADGTYEDRFVADASGKANRRITLCGSRDAVIDGGTLREGYGFHLRADHWTLAGFSVTNASKGIVADGASFNLLRELAVFRIGEEGVHFRAFSSDNVLERSEIRDVGRRAPEHGEGVYIGSAHANWCDHSDCRPDASDRNLVRDNVIGPDTAAEGVDVKEGTTGGTISGNTFDGAGMTAADSWVDVKGSRYLILGNTGTNAPVDGFQVHVEASGWGHDNVFRANVADVGGPGYGFRIDEDAEGTVVDCDNAIANAEAGFANVECGEARRSPR